MPQSTLKGDVRSRGFFVSPPHLPRADGAALGGPDGTADGTEGPTDGVRDTAGEWPKAWRKNFVGKKETMNNSNGLQPSSFLFLVVRPGAPSSVLAPSSDATRP